jgi:hypothetical protein
MTRKSGDLPSHNSKPGGVSGAGEMAPVARPVLADKHPATCLSPLFMPLPQRGGRDDLDDKNA